MTVNRLINILGLSVHNKWEEDEVFLGNKEVYVAFKSNPEERFSILPEGIKLDTSLTLFIEEKRILCE